MRPPAPSYPRAEIEARVCGLLEAGWTEARVCAEAWAPSRQTLHRWAKDDPAFATRLAWARDWGRGVRRAPALEPARFDEARAEALLLEVRRGVSLRELLRRPEGPRREVLNAWKRLRPDFATRLAEMVRLAKALRPLPWPFDPVVADRLVVRVSRGEELRAIHREAGLPGRAAVDRWRRERPAFAQAMKDAALAGRRARAGRQSACTPELTDAIAMHVMAGGSLRSAAEAPGMPHRVTLYGWVRTKPEFARAMAVAKMLRDDRLEGQMLALADRAAAAAIRKRAGRLSGGRKPRR